MNKDNAVVGGRLYHSASARRRTESIMEKKLGRSLPGWGSLEMILVILGGVRP